MDRQSHLPPRLQQQAQHQQPDAKAAALARCRFQWKRHTYANVETAVGPAGVWGHLWLRMRWTTIHSGLMP